MPSTPNPSAAAEPDPRLSALLFVLRERPGADKPDEALAQVQPFSVTLPGGASVTMAPAWYDLIGDLQLRLVRDTPDSMLTLHAAELDELGLGADEAIAAALANLERRHGPPAVTPWHNLRRVGTAEDELDSNWFLARAFWRARLAEHPAGLVVAVPRTDLLLFAPADDAPAVASITAENVAIRAAAAAGANRQRHDAVREARCARRADGSAVGDLDRAASRERSVDRATAALRGGADALPAGAGHCDVADVGDRDATAVAGAAGTTKNAGSTIAASGEGNDSDR